MKKNKKKEKPQNKYLETAQNLLKIVGEKNFQQISNCVNRVRFYVIDKHLVDEQQIDQINFVHGHVWSGNELQVVIGSDSYKVRELIEHLVNNQNTNFEMNANQKPEKQGLWKTFLGAANGIIIPIVPLLFASGMIMAIITILQSSGVLATTPNIKEGEVYVTQMDLWSGLMYIFKNTLISLVSVFFCYSTVKYLKGDPIMGIVIGLLISSRYFLTQFDAISQTMESGSWKLFNLGSYEVKIEAYDSNIIPAIGVGVIYVYLDRFIKKWMPGDIDLIFRPLLSLTIIFFIAFFFVIPVLGLVEYGLNKAITWFYEIKFGIGGFIIGFFYEPLVVTGIAWPTILNFDGEWVSSYHVVPLRALPIIDGATLAVFGTLMALYIKETTQKKKTNAVISSIPLFLGSTEPAVYGILVNKPKAFWLTNLGSGFAGMAMAWIQLTKTEIGGFGLLGIIGFGTEWEQGLLYLGISAAAALLNFVLVLFLVNEKKAEFKLVKHNFWTITNYLMIFQKRQFKTNPELKKVSRQELQTEFDDVLFLVKNHQKENKEYYQTYLEYQKALDRLTYFEKKFKQQESKIIKKISLESKAKEKYQNKLMFLETKYQTDQQSIKEKFEELKEKFDLNSSKLFEDNQELYIEVIQLTNKIFEDNQELQQQFENKLWNSLNDNLIVSGYLTKKDDQISKTDFYQTENQWLLKFLPKTF